MTLRHARQRGFSLVELAVALSIAAVLGVLVFSLLPLGNRVLDADRQQQELAQAEQALLGYMHSHAHLPSADTNGDGRADGANAGWLPVADLGLPSRMRLHYEVQPSLTTPPSADLFEPVLPGNPSLANANGLDLCMQLLLYQREGIASTAGLGMPVAYYLGHSGVSGHGRIEADAQWQPAAQIMPGEGTDTGMAIMAAGPGELASRLSCPDRLARAQGSAQTTYAAYSAMRMTDFNLEFREFDIKIAETIQYQAQVARDLAIYALAESITNQAIALTLIASGWPPDGSSIGAGIKQLAKSLLAIGQATSSLVSAEKTYKEAEEGVEDAEIRRNQVKDFYTHLQTLHAHAHDTTVGLDQAGLKQ